MTDRNTDASASLAPGGEVWIFTRRTRQLVQRLAYAVLVSFVAGLTTIAWSIWYTNKVDSESNRQWCDLLVQLDNPIPPDNRNARAVDAAAKLHALRVNFGC